MYFSSINFTFSVWLFFKNYLSFTFIHQLNYFRNRWILHEINYYWILLGKRLIFFSQKTWDIFGHWPNTTFLQEEIASSYAWHILPYDATIDQRRELEKNVISKRKYSIINKPCYRYWVSRSYKHWVKMVGKLLSREPRQHMVSNTKSGQQIAWQIPGMSSLFKTGVKVYWSIAFAIAR